MRENPYFFTDMMVVLRDLTLTADLEFIERAMIKQRHRHERGWSYFDKYDYFLPRVRRYLRELLDDMAEVGIVVAVGEGENRRWGLNSDWAREERRNEDREKPPSPPDDNLSPGGGDGDGNGGGLREVLSHSLLFSLPPEDFDKILSRSLGGAQ